MRSSVQRSPHDTGANPAPAGDSQQNHAELTASHVFHRFPRNAMPVAVAGDGVYVIDRQGKRYLDASSGAAVSCLGHSHPAVIRAIQRQAEQLAFAHTSFFTNEPLEELAALLSASAPPGLDRVYFVSGGSEAVEAALKLARQYQVERGEPQRTRVMSRRQSYHGNTLGALAAGGNRWRRAPFEPLLTQALDVAPCYAYRDRRPDESEEAYGERLACEFEQAIVAAGPETVMCFIAETVCGATLGAVPAVPGYFRRIRDICDRYGILLILDEVMCGMGRTGTLYACEQEGVIPDLLVIAKGLGAGYQPIGAVHAARHVFDAIVGGSGFFQHGHTYSGHALACAAAVAVQKALRDEHLIDNVQRRGPQLMQRLRERFGMHPYVGDIRGRGLLLALEFVAERDARTPFPAEARTAQRIKASALEHGLMCYPAGGVIDGKVGDHAMLAPPFIIEEKHLDEMVDKLAETIDAVFPDAARRR
ncbi:hypothetical protein SAMN06265784_102525 [Paraburkholderia susongensis]|uniref:Diaminobutyrate--2-oxoglutarate transaminase n=2 Tax=Paraburkholderia susongensis TaxID=1515439 RepID=A0A1X7JFT9_9BURK|nr:hypothetical protein SAMN06265784_102525 [Paraburkholderia susongensis]